MTKDEAAKFILSFGKYQGRTFGSVYAEDARYLAWCYDNLSKVFCADFMEACEAFGIYGEE